MRVIKRKTSKLWAVQPPLCSICNPPFITSERRDRQSLFESTSSWTEMFQVQALFKMFCKRITQKLLWAKMSSTWTRFSVLHRSWWVNNSSHSSYNITGTSPYWFTKFISVSCFHQYHHSAFISTYSLSCLPMQSLTTNPTTPTRSHQWELIAGPPTRNFPGGARFW